MFAPQGAQFFRLLRNVSWNEKILKSAYYEKECTESTSTCVSVCVSVCVYAHTNVQHVRGERPSARARFQLYTVNQKI